MKHNLFIEMLQQWLTNNKPLYVIYDKDEQEKVDARWEKMHGKMN